MKPHKHAEVIKAFVDGIQCEVRDFGFDWYVVTTLRAFDTAYEARIKPEPKSDFHKTFFVHGNYFSQGTHISENSNEIHNLVLYFNGETGELKSAKVINETT
jgi:hypothetical protein